MKHLYGHLHRLVPVLAVVAVFCLLAPAPVQAADDPAKTQIEADIRTAHQNGDDAALEKAVDQYRAYLLTQNMTEEEVFNYLDNWLRTQLDGISNDTLTDLMDRLFPLNSEYLNDPPDPETPITQDEKNASPV
ncbi:MAG: hypothetical protein AB1Z81_11310 [Desulfotignum sp.]